jgi:hypothetical protein
VKLSDEFLYPILISAANEEGLEAIDVEKPEDRRLKEMLK